MWRILWSGTDAQIFPHIAFDISRRLSPKEVCAMEPELFWGLFAATGRPLAYMLFRSAEQEAEEAEPSEEES